LPMLKQSRRTVSNVPRAGILVRDPLAPLAWDRERVIVFLASAALVTNWLYHMIAALYLARTSDIDAASLYSSLDTVPSGANLILGLSLLACIASGTLAAFDRFRHVPRSVEIVFWSIQLWSLAIAVPFYGTDLLGTKFILRGHSPALWFPCFLVLAGANLPRWRVFTRVITVLCLATALVACYELVTLQGSNRNYVLQKLLRHITTLSLPSIWLLLNKDAPFGWPGRILPFLVFSLASIVSQTRSWTIIAALGFITWIVTSLRTQQRVVVGAAAVVVLGVVLVMGTDRSSGGAFSDALTSLLERIDEDSRSEQYQYFFADVAPTELVLGRGPGATYKNFGNRDYAFLDNGILWMLFIGGIPLLSSYLWLVIGALIPLVRRWSLHSDIASSAVLVTWLLVLCGLGIFASPGFGYYSLFVCLIGGRAWALIASPDKACGRWGAGK